MRRSKDTLASLRRPTKRSKASCFPLSNWRASSTSDSRSNARFLLLIVDDLDARPAQQSVVNQARLRCTKNPGSMTFVEAGRRYFDTERAQPGGLLGLFRADSYSEISRRQLAGLQVLSCIVGRTGSERRQQEFGRRHACIGAAIVGRLVANYTVAPGLYFEPRITKKLCCDFHFFVDPISPDAGDTPKVMRVTSAERLHAHEQNQQEKCELYRHISCAWRLRDSVRVA